MFCQSGTVAHIASQWYDMLGRLEAAYKCCCSSKQWTDVMVAILKVWHHIKNLSLSVDAHFTLRTILQNFIPIRFEIWSLRLLWSPNKNKNKQNNKMSSGMVSVPNPKIQICYYFCLKFMALEFGLHSQSPLGICILYIWDMCRFVIVEFRRYRRVISHSIWSS